VEDVFDVQIEGTENFIANGLVSHNTRWHDDDLSGRLIQAQEMGGDQWEILSLKAIDEKREGRALWPGWFPIERLEQIKQVVGPRDWSALYQQNPVPDEGGYFQRDWIQWYNDKPKHLRIYGASDYAVTDDGGDYTVHLVVGVDPNDDIYLLDIWREQADSETWVEAFIELVKKWKPLEWAEENGQIIKGVGPFIVKRQRETEAYCYRRQFASSHDKPTRAQAIRGRMAQKRVFFPSGEDWAATMIHELMRFPAGKNDDQVDALSLVGRMLADMRPGQVPPKPEKIKFEQDLTFNEMRDSVRRSRERDEW
jgi:predicted phage terminase large subunit-like protein